MTGRELYEAIYVGEKVDHLPVQGIWPWGETCERWKAESGSVDEDYNRVLGLTSKHDDYVVSLPLDLSMVPTFPIHVLEEGPEYVTLIDEFGVTKRLMRRDYDCSGGYKTGAGQTSSMAHWVDFPVKDMRSWKEIYEERFRPDIAGRVPDDWEDRKVQIQEEAKTHLVSLFSFPFFGFFGPMRELMGLEGLVYAMADNPELIHTMVDDLATYFVLTFANVVPETPLDQVTFFEDMCATKAPLISPAGFREFFAPGYRKAVSGLRDLGVRWLLVDTDGNPWNLIPEYIACGLNGTSPCEVQSTMDVGALREAFPDFILHGGIDKRALASGPEAIDAELRRCMTVAWKSGGYIPSLDHGAPPDISWQNACHYAKRYVAWCESPDGG